MICGETVFSEDEVTELLEELGFEQGTEGFSREFRQRFMPVDSMSDNGPARFVERDDFQPNR